jgi:hypothetical protein
MSERGYAEGRLLVDRIHSRLLGAIRFTAGVTERILFFREPLAPSFGLLVRLTAMDFTPGGKSRDRK